jgi:hypothetical protein
MIHGSDFTSKHMEQVAEDLGIELIFSEKGVARGAAKSSVSPASRSRAVVVAVREELARIRAFRGGVYLKNPSLYLYPSKSW